MNRLLVNSSICSGCRICEMVCSYHHEGKFSSNLSRVTVIKIDKIGMDYPLLCRQCPECQPEIICSTGSFSRGENGIVNVQEKECIECNECIQACPFNAISFNSVENVAEKCNLCSHRIDSGLKPFCVECCPTKAITFGNTENPNSQASKLLLRKKCSIPHPHFNTDPSTYYCPPR